MQTSANLQTNCDDSYTSHEICHHVITFFESVNETNILKKKANLTDVLDQWYKRFKETSRRSNSFQGYIAFKPFWLRVLICSLVMFQMMGANHSTPKIESFGRTSNGSDNCIRRKSVRKLLSTSSSVPPTDRNLGNVPYRLNISSLARPSSWGLSCPQCCTAHPHCA